VVIALKLPPITIEKRYPAPAVTPQALAWDGSHLWIGSRDLRKIYQVDPDSWKVLSEFEAPGIPWAAVAVDGELRLTLGQDPDDDRYIYRYTAGGRFQKICACPDFTGSYLSSDGKDLYLSQWYKQRILKMNDAGEILQTIDVGAEICGHTFVDGMIYVLRGQEKPEEEWRMGRLNPAEAQPQVQDIASIPFACRSLAFDGRNFWSNHRAANETISFSLPVDTTR
jgi:hypothetical protein